MDLLLKHCREQSEEVGFLPLNIDLNVKAGKKHAVGFSLKCLNIIFVALKYIFFKKGFIFSLIN